MPDTRAYPSVLLGHVCWSRLWLSMLVLVASSAPTAWSAEPAAVAKEIERSFGGINYRIDSDPNRAETELIAAYQKFQSLKAEAPDHPGLPMLEEKINELAKKLEKRLDRPVAFPGAPPVEQAALPPREAAAPTSTQPTPDSPATSAPVGLTATVQRRVDGANGTLDKADVRIAKGDGSGAVRLVEQAQGAYDKIFEYYADKFDPAAPEITGLKARIDLTRELAATAKPAADDITAYDPNNAEFDRTLKSAETQLNDFDGMKQDSDGSEMWLGPMAAKLQQAEILLNDVRHRHQPLVDQNPDEVAALDRRLAAAQTELEDMRRAQPATTEAKAEVAHAEALTRIQSRFEDKGMRGDRHRENVGRMIWSDRAIGLQVQDTVPLKSEFDLTEPLFGRIYLYRSLGNTPVYSTVDDQPRESIDYQYEYKLFVDGEEQTPNFDHFAKGRLHDEAGQTWTTWQLGLNPQPYNDGFKAEAEAWRKVVNQLTPGGHEVRLELWSVQGQHRSAEPLSVGTFDLNVDADQRLAVHGGLPGDAYGGADLDRIRGQMRAALLGPVAKSPAEILDVRVTSDWNHLVYTDTERRYRAIMGTVLWADRDDDRVCRYTSYNFTSDELDADNWGELKFRSFCNGCPEGDADCPG